MTALADGQYELLEIEQDNDGFVFGRGTKTLVSAIEHGAPDIADQDALRPRADGVRFGRDYRTSRTLTLDLTINTYAGDGQAIKDELEAAWLAERVRAQPGQVCALRYRRGEAQRRAYGRPRKIAVTSGSVKRGLIPATAEFVTADHVFYDDAEQGFTVPIVPASGGGLTSPLTSPLTTVATTAGNGEVMVSGSIPAWCWFTISGPITNPVVEVRDRWLVELRYSIAFDEQVTVDPRPWSRGVFSSFGANLAGAFTPDSTRLSQLKVPPGSSEFVLRGVDQTGKARLQVSYRAAHASF